MALDEYLETMPTGKDGVAVPPPPPVALLLDAGIDVDTGRLQEHVAALSDRRVRVHALVRANGWDWRSDVCGRR